VKKKASVKKVAKAAIRMFREGDPGSERAVDAKQVLGPEWLKEMESGSRGTC
jgi:hypothetical protein